MSCAYCDEGKHVCRLAYCDQRGECCERCDEGKARQMFEDASKETPDCRLCWDELTEDQRANWFAQAGS